MITGTEGATCFPGLGEHIDPMVCKGLVDKLTHGRGEFPHFRNQLGPRFLHGVGLAALPHGGKQIIEGQAVRVPQIGSLGTQITAEMGEIFPDGCPHGVQGLLIHAAFLERHIQDAVIALCLCQGTGLHLDGIQAEGHGQLNLFVGCQFSIIGILAHGRIGIIGHATNSSQGELLSTVADKVGAVQLVPQLGESIAAAQLHFQHPGFNGFRHHVPGHMGHPPQGKGNLLQLG